MNRNLSWRIFEEIHRLYLSGEIKTKSYVLGHVYIKHLESYDFIEIDSPKKRLIAKHAFRNNYETELLSSHNKYATFLEQYDLLDYHWNFKEEDLLTLIIIAENKETIIESGQTRNQISSFYFKNEDAKYLRNSVSLSKAILKITGLKAYPEDEKDQQYIISTPTKRPTAILLCENIDKLRLPDIFRNAGIELWYAGGRNIAKLAHIRENEKLPFYYACDWDHDGLDIFQAIKRDYIPALNLVIPMNWTIVKKPIGNHKSLWNELSSYDFFKFENDASNIIRQLILEDEWIEEESFTFDLQR